jgi:hypothetical protein
MPGSFGTKSGDNGVVGQTNSDSNAGVNGRNDGKGFGVFGFSQGGAGVEGHSATDTGVVGFCTSGTGVRGTGRTGVAGQTNSDSDAGVNGRNDGKGFGVFGFSQGGAGVEGHAVDGNGVVGFSEKGFAGRFQGNVLVTGDITAHDLAISGGDCAENFDVAGDPEIASPGTVMVIDEEGALRPSCAAYDKKVVGVISGAGDYQPGILLNKRDEPGIRVPIALVGRIFCKVDAQNAPIEIGDLLTTSPVRGHAMKAEDPLRAFGSVIGKALRPLDAGQGFIPILIALQ